ncbi:hypothetical protein BZG36_00169 [Bifiguratus adelaidae]|uniref:TPR-like protein n=1 Tax=Bifiguratus adelaidae TaxID=1938954 RepID=A0A261Y854_9FUNG|nr:hypothetical protein BZG36_00169 [Bifiguratus adelaidae]
MKRVKAGKKKGGEEKVPETFDEYMEEGVRLEEKGERYGPSDKAKRLYERSAETYAQAHSLSTNDVDCLYNWGRVLFILINFQPEHEVLARFNLLTESVRKFRQALTIDPDYTDALFNLGQALVTHFELLEDLPNVIDALQQGIASLHEAVSLFERVYALQTEELESRRTSGAEGSMEDTSDANVPVNDLNAQMEDDAPSTMVTEVTSVTEFSLIDTLLSTVNTLTSLASILPDVSASSVTYQTAIAKLNQAETLLTSQNSDNEEAREKYKDLQLQYAQTLSSHADRQFQDSGRVDDKSYLQSVQRVDTILDHQPRHVEALCDKADILTSFAQAQLLFAVRSGIDYSESIWSLYTQATQIYMAAFEVEPKNQSILLKLGDINCARARLPMPIAQRNQAQLLKNAEFFYKSVVENNRQDTTAWIGYAFACWKQTSLGAAEKGVETDKILRMWRRVGGTDETLQDAARDNDLLEPDFFDHVREVISAMTTTGDP